MYACLLDYMPFHLLPHCIGYIISIITRIVNLPLSSGFFPTHFKFAFVKPILKKSKLDSNDLKKLPSNIKLNFLSKLAERVFANCRSSHLSFHGLMSNLQSA